jgi:hypothetical protein
MKPKFLPVTFLGCIMYANAFAQITITAQKTMGGSGGDYFTSMAPTSDGGLISGGTSWSDISFEKSENGRGNGDYWVMKTDKDGKIQWDKTIGGSDNDNLKSVIQTSDGGYALIGESNSNISFEKTENSRGQHDFWLVKLDGTGNIQWDKTIGGSGTEYIDHIEQTKDGGYILAGSTDSYMSGEKSEDSRGAVDYWVVKLDANGQKVWDKTIGGNSYDWCSPFALTKDGGVIVGGFSISNISGEKTENQRGGSDYWIVKLDSKGNIEWDKTIGGSADEWCHGLYQTTNGDYVIGGSSASGISGEKTAYNRGGVDYWVVKIDKKRNIQWDKTIGGNADDWCNSMIPTKAGGTAIFGGSLSSASGDKSEYSRGGADFWLVNLDHKGKLLWEKTVGGYYDDWGDAVVETEKNVFWIGGLSYSPIGADKTEFARDNGDYWIVKLNDDKHSSPKDSTSKNVYSQLIQRNLNDPAFTVYPNPVKNQLNIYTGSKAFLSLTDQSGKLILTKTIDGKGLVDCNKLPAGVYILKNNTTGETQKIMVSK